MSWKTWIFDVILILIGSILVISVFIFNTSSDQPIQRPLLYRPITLEKPEYIYHIPLPSQEENIDHRPEKLLPQKQKKSFPKQRRLGMTICDNNPNAPDFMEKQLRRANGQENNTCAKIKMRLPF